MIFTLDILFEKMPEYDFVIKDPSVLANKYKTFHLLPENESFYRPGMIYLTDSYDMERFNTFRNSQKNGRHDCLIYTYQKDSEYADGASVYIKTADELAIILNRMQEFVIDLMMFENSLNESIVQKSSVQNILDAVCARLGNPAAIIDPSLKAIACSYNELPDDDMFRYITESGLTYHYSDENWIKYDDNFSYILYPENIDHRYSRIFYRINVTQSISMVLYCVITHERFAGSILSMIHLFSPYIRQCLLQCSEVSNSEIYKSLITDLLSSDAIDEPSVRTRCRAININYNDSYILICTNTSETSVPAEHICARIHALFSESMPFAYGEKVIAILKSSENPQLLKDSLAVLCAEMDIQIGISRPFFSLFTTSTAYAQADAAITISVMLTHSRFISEFGIPPFQFSGRVFDYADISEYHAYYLASSSLDYTSFCMPEILRLVDSQNAKHHAAIAILYVYLTNGFSYLDTARSLFMHRNNVVYHINRLKESCLPRLEDPAYVQQIISTFHVLFLFWK